ncbi:TIGR04338 family metallohydrolase [Gordonia hydrophobica]|uniref:TIGR04338 family metallohydrolase n=1 Tax=Gordonia hydrophobica TaxID=40516 RepID=A0ABZ2TVY0_9ACTN|nr:TIGR04338 family metallohydrolase [Gordonia hydrophobica]MBM7365929.1 putative metallohydrolase (TIGR04338 family) [Gordonia hydrophobica]
MSRDSARSRVYDAERMVHRMLDRAGGTHTVQIAGAQLTVPADARFGSVDDVAAYVGRVLELGPVRERFPRARLPVAVRVRRGQRAAHYERGAATIAVPEDTEGRWALRELVVLHEIAHHLDDVGDPAHGPSFVTTLIDLVESVMGPEVGLIYRVVFDGVG